MRYCLEHKIYNINQVNTCLLYTSFEQAWIPAGAEHQDAAKQFVAYLYSDEACKLFEMCIRDRSYCSGNWNFR